MSLLIPASPEPFVSYESALLLKIWKTTVDPQKIPLPRQMIAAEEHIVVVEFMRRKLAFAAWAG